MSASAGFTKADLELAAGSRSYERGLGYLHAVADLEITVLRMQQKRKRNLMEILDQNGL